MKITLLITTFNSTSQATYTYLKDIGHKVDVVYAINEKQMKNEIKSFSPDIIICPFLKKFVPKDIYSSYPTFIMHPGIRGDRGAYSLENAIIKNKKEWGIVYLRADDEFDAGDIYAHEEFAMRFTYKASIYRQEVNKSSLKGLKSLLKRISQDNFTPLAQPKISMHTQITQKHRKINWERDTTKEIMKKIYMSDSHPGVLDNILGIECYLYGAWEEEKLHSKETKKIIAKRDGAICLSTIDGAIWISHLKEVDKFKLPATYVLKDKIKGVKEERLPLIFDMSYKTFYEISSTIKDEVAYLCFNFHNGAMSSNQCIKLKYAFETLKEEAKVIVLIGGADFFSNGIHLNILEDSKKNAEDGWSNINAMNELVKSILFADDVITVASLHSNAGAGGVFLALACDYVVGHEDVVLNPHYKTLGLSGSEYHTYTLTKRVGKSMAEKLLNKMLPISGRYAKKIGMLDALFQRDEYFKELREYCASLLSDEDRYDEFLWQKEEYLHENKEFIEEKREEEIKIMHPEFWNKESEFHILRYNFVYKICPLKTPKRLKYNA